MEIDAMNEHRDDGMVEATRLTREGRLAEAAALIQRLLGRTSAPPSASSGHSGALGTIDVTARVSTDPSDVAPPAPPILSHGPGQESAPLLTAIRGALRLGVPTGRSGRRPARRPIPPEAVAPAVGRWIEGTHTNSAGSRGYKLYIPSRYQRKPVPLIVMLHGCTQYPDDFAAGTRMNFLAEADDFLVAYPAQAETANASRCWNWFQPADQQRDQGEPLLIADITRQVMSEYRVDARRVYVAGLSAGGAMAAIMATTYPDLFAALGVHSGLAPGCAHDLPSAFHAMQKGAPAEAPMAGRAIPLIVFQGDSDSTVHPANAEHLVRYWTATAGTAPTVTVRRSQKPAGRDFTSALHLTAGGKTLVEHWTVHGAGHAWSGGVHAGSHTDPDGPDASRELVRFFQQHPAR
jgi:poly(hydroxyalkanoate) depolymerase family esterase